MNRWKIACINWNHPPGPHALAYLWDGYEMRFERYFPTWRDAVNWVAERLAPPRGHTRWHTPPLASPLVLNWRSSMRCTIREHDLCRFAGTCECTCHQPDEALVAAVLDALPYSSIPTDQDVHDVLMVIREYEARLGGDA